MEFKKILSAALIFQALVFGSINNAFAADIIPEIVNGPTPEFVDVALGMNGWIIESYGGAIVYLWERGIVEGYPDGTFRSLNTINRAEFLKITLKSGGYETSGANCFPDVTNQWFAEYVCTAKNLGFVEGFPDGNFHPEQEITFAEASKIVSNALELEIDNNLNDAWYHKYVAALQVHNAVLIGIESFGKLITRGEMAEMIVRVLSGDSMDISATYESIYMLEQNRKNFINVTSPESELFSEYVSKLNIYPSENELMLNIDDAVLREIIFLAYKKNINYFNKISYRTMYLESHKGVLYFLYPWYRVYISMPSLDAATAVFADTAGKITEDQNVLLIKDKRTVYQLNWYLQELTTFEGIDSATFVNIDSLPLRDVCRVNQPCSSMPVFKDKNNVYYADMQSLVVIEQADPATFVRIPGDSTTLKNLFDLTFFKDKNRVFYIYFPNTSIDPITGADPETFEYICQGDRTYFKDKNYVYIFADYIFAILPGVNPQLFNISTYEKN